MMLPYKDWLYLQQKLTHTLLGLQYNHNIRSIPDDKSGYPHFVNQIKMLYYNTSKAFGLGIVSCSSGHTHFLFYKKAEAEICYQIFLKIGKYLPITKERLNQEKQFKHMFSGRVELKIIKNWSRI